MKKVKHLVVHIESWLQVMDRYLVLGIWKNIPTQRFFYIKRHHRVTKTSIGFQLPIYICAATDRYAYLLSTYAYSDAEDFFPSKEVIGLQDMGLNLWCTWIPQYIYKIIQDFLFDFPKCFIFLAQILVYLSRFLCF